MPRFVILKHDHPSLHWDFMLEAGQVLRTWRLHAPPTAGNPCEVSHSFDHRLVYLDYEGPISGGRGSVKRWDNGTFDWLADTPERVAVRIEGKRLQGLLEIVRLASGTWSLHYAEAAPDSNQPL